MTGRQFKDISVLAGTAGFGPTTSEPKSEVLPFTLHPYISLWLVQAISLSFQPQTSPIAGKGNVHPLH